MESGRSHPSRDDDHWADRGESERIRELLSGSRPREILHRLLDGDPLRFREAVERRQNRDGYFLYEERLRLRAIARAAYDAMTYRGDPPLADWIERCIDRAVRDLIEEQRAEEMQLLPCVESPDHAFYAALAHSIGIDADLARLACVRLNALPAIQRRTFRGLAVERVSVERCAELGLGTPSEVLVHFERAVREVARVFEARGESGDWSPLP